MNEFIVKNHNSNNNNNNESQEINEYIFTRYQFHVRERFFGTSPCTSQFTSEAEADRTVA